MKARLGTVAGAVVLFLVAALSVVTLVVEREAEYVHDSLGGYGPSRALVLYHPSRDARFSDELSVSVANGFRRAGLAVERATLTGRTPRDPAGYTLIAVVSNTYFWTPDRPTRDYLRKAHLEGTPAIGLMAGAGATGRAERMLREALRRTGARSVETRSFWLWRPNDEGRLRESNRAVALDEAERFAFEAALKAVRSSSRVAPID
jgi:hypothetical protein